MKITAQFDYLYTGESNSRTLYLERDEKYADKNICLGFVTPLGRLYITEPIPFPENRREYLIPEGLADGRGRLFVQLIATEGEEYVAKSKLYEYPVYASVDDLSLPEASAEDVKSISVLFEMVKKKADFGHNHDDSYYTENEVDTLLSEKSDSTHSHNWEEIKGRPGEVSSVLLCSFVLRDVYEPSLNNFTCFTEGDFSSVESGRDAKVTIKLADGSTYEEDVEIQDAESQPLISFNNELSAEDLVSGNATLKPVPVNSNKPSFTALFYPASDGSCEMFMSDDGYDYEGAEIEVYSEDVVKLSAKAFEAVDAAVEGSKALITSGGVKKELNKKSDTDHLHDSRYYTEEEIDLKLSELGKAEHDHDGRYYTENEVNTLLSGKSDTGHDHDSRYYTENEVDTLLSGKSGTGHSHSEYLTVNDLPSVPVNVSQLQNDAGYVTIDHSHDGRYYTENEVDTLLSGKSDTGHDHDSRYYTENEVDTLLSEKSDSTHSHNWEEIKGRPGEVSSVLLCSFVLRDVYEPSLNTFTCFTEGDFSSIKSGTDARITIKLADGSTYEEDVEIQDAESQPLISFNNELSAEDLVSGNATLEPVPVNSNKPSFTALFYPASDGSCEMFMSDDGYDYEGAEIEVYSEDVVKLSAKAFEAVDAAVEGSKALITSGGVKKELGKKSDTDHLHDSRYYTEEEIDVKLSELGKAEHDHDGRYYTENEVNTLLSGKSDTGHDHDGKYYTENEVDTLLSGKSDTGHSHAEYALKSDIPDVPVNVSQLQNDAGYVTIDHNHDGRYYTENEVDTLLSGKSDTGHSHSEYALKSDIPDVPVNVSRLQNDAGYVTIDHGHDGRYYTEAEVNSLLSGKSDTGHDHDSRYYTAEEIDGMLTDVNVSGHNHDGRYYTEAETDALLLSHQHSWEDIDGRPGEVSYTELCSFTLTDIYEAATGTYACYATGDFSRIKSGTNARVAIKLSDGSTYEEDLGIINADGQPLVSFNNSVSAEDIASGKATMKPVPLDSSKPSFTALFYAEENGFCDVFVYSDTYEGAEIVISSGGLIKLSNEALYTADSAVEGSSALITSGAVKKELDKKSDAGHNHDEKYMTKELVVTGVLDMANGTMTGASATFSEIKEAVDNGISVKLNVDISAAAGAGSFMMLHYLVGSDNEHIFDVVTDFNVPTLIRGMCLVDNTWKVSFSSLASMDAVVKKERTLTGTTSADGIISAKISSDDFIVFSACCASNMCIPFCLASGDWGIKVINAETMAPVTSSDVEVTYFYTNRIKE